MPVVTLMVLLVALGCTPSPKPSAAAQRSLGVPADPIADAPSTAPDAEGEREIADWIAQYQAVYDVFTAALSQVQTPPSGFVPACLTSDVRSGFPGAGFARVQAVAYWNSPGLHSRRFNEPACRFGPLTEDGTLCSSAQRTDVPLDAAAVGELLAAVNGEPVPKPRGNVVRMDTGGLFHAFVFYDDGDTPVAVIRVNLMERELRTYPRIGPRDNRLHRVSARFRQLYAELCPRLQLPMCLAWSSDLETIDRIQAEIYRRKIERTGQRSPLEALGDRPLDTFKVSERRALCAWSHLKAFRAPQGPGAGEGFGLESLDGKERWSGRLLPWWECVEQFPRCSLPLSKVLPCQEIALAGDVGFFAPSARACRELAGCLWGVEEQAPSAP